MQTTLDNSLAQGIVELARYNELSALNSSRLNDNAASVDKFGKSGSTAASKIGQLSYQVNDIVGGLVSGQSPLTILAQQGTQVSQILRE